MPEPKDDAPLPSAPAEDAEQPALDMEGIEIDIRPDGTVHLHTACRVGEDPAACRERLRFLVEALGIPLEGVVTEVAPPDSSAP